MDEKYVCLACGKPRPKPQVKDLTRDHYGRPMTFCDKTCLALYTKKQPKA